MLNVSLIRMRKGEEMAILVGRQEDGGAPARSGGSFGLGVPAHFGAAVRRLYLFIFGDLLVLLIGFSGRDCFLKTAYLLPNGWLALIGVSAAALLYLSLHLLARYVERRIERLEQSLVHRWALAAATLLLFLTQMAIAYNIAFRTGWDAGVVFDFAWQTVDNQNIEGYRYYFSHYPNNILIAWMYIQALRLYQAVAQGALGASHLHLLIALNCVISCTAALLVYRVVHLLSGGRCFAWMAWAAFTAVAGLSPWILIPYSDTVGILFPALAFFLYLRPFRSRALKGALMGLCLYAGYHIKPTAAIPFIAIAIVEAVRLIRRPSLWKRLVRPALSLLAVCVALQAAFTLLIIPSLGIDVDRELSLGPTHFIKMGLNPQTDGAYLEDDVLYSQSFANRQQRDQANMEVIRARLSEYGLGGYLDFLSRKALSVFNSGSFAWAAEGSFTKRSTADKRCRRPTSRDTSIPMGIGTPFS